MSEVCLGLPLQTLHVACFVCVILYCDDFASDFPLLCRHSTGLLTENIHMATRTKIQKKAVGSKRIASAPVISKLTSIWAAHHEGFDRVVFQFDGPVPARRDVAFVPEIIADASGLVVPMFGAAFLSVTFSDATNHDDLGTVFTAERTTCGLPNVIQVVRSGDFEAVLSFGIGLARRGRIDVFTLSNPSRVVIDIAAAFTTVQTRVFFVDSHRFEIGQEPYTKAVFRSVIPPNVAARSLDWLFAGPTPAELAGGLTFVNSDATGFSNLTISNRVARVRLAGGADSHGSTLTIAAEIFPLLKQFPTVRWVKILDPNGQTQNPTGQSDSIPAGLEP